MRVKDIVAVNITLDVDSEPSLFILLAADGTVNRLGTGAVTNKEKDLFIGRSLEPLLDKLLSNLTDEMLRFMGGYELPDKRGPLCRLSVGLQFSNGETDGFGFTYGAESEGPPREIAEFVRAAIMITKPWYDSQKRMVRANESGADKKEP